MSGDDAEGMMAVLGLLRTAKHRMPEDAIASLSGIDAQLASVYLYRLRLRGLVRCSGSWMHKRGGGGHSYNTNPANPLWEAAEPGNDGT